MMLVQHILYQHHNVVTMLQEHCTNIRPYASARQNEDFECIPGPLLNVTYWTEDRLNSSFMYSQYLLFLQSHAENDLLSF